MIPKRWRISERIRTTMVGGHFITFGDKTRRYELLENKTPIKFGFHDFILRTKDRPDEVHAKFTLGDLEFMGMMDIFPVALTHAQEILDNTLAGKDHLQASIKTLLEQFGD